MGIRFLLVALLATVGAAGANGQDARNLTADESVRLGLQRNARIAGVRAQVRAAAAAHRLSRAGRRPSLNAAADYLRLSANVPDVQFSFPNIPGPITFVPIKPNRYTTELSLDYTLFSGGRSSNEVRAAGWAAAAARFNAEQMDSDVAFEIRRAYWELHRALALRAALGQALERVQAHLQVVEQRFQEGAALRRDVLTAQTRRSEVLLELVDADNAASSTRLQLNYLIGLPLDTVLVLATVPDSQVMRVTADTTAVATVPAVAALSAEIDVLRAQLRASESARWPQIDLIGRYLYAQPNPYFFAEQDRFHQSWELGVSTRWSVFDGGRRRNESAELRAQVTAAEAMSADAAAQSEVLQRTRRLDIARAVRASQLAAQQVAAAEETFRVVREQFREGAALAAEVLDAEDDYRRAQARWTSARADFEIAQAALLQARGLVWPP